MKKVIVLFAVLMLMSVGVFASGLSLAFAVVPGTDIPALLIPGYDFGSAGLEVFKEDYSTPFGYYGFGLLWTPQIGGFGYRAGIRLIINWDEDDATINYSTFAFVVGVSDTWGPIRLFGEVDIAPTGELIVVPVVGVNILFDGLIPSTQ